MLLGYLKAASHEIVDIGECPDCDARDRRRAAGAAQAGLADLRHAESRSACSSPPPLRASTSPLPAAANCRTRPRGGSRFRHPAGICTALGRRGNHHRAEEAGGDVWRSGRWSRRPAPSCRRCESAEAGDGRAWSRSIWLRQEQSPICSPARAPSRSGWRAARGCMPSRPMPPRSPRSTAASRFAAGLKPVSVERRDLFRRPLTAKELERLRRRGLRSAARRRGGSGASDRALVGAAGGRRLVQPGDAGARSAHPARRRLPSGARHADRPVPVVAACRGGGTVGEAAAACDAQAVTPVRVALTGPAARAGCPPIPARAGWPARASLRGTAAALRTVRD